MNMKLTSKGIFQGLIVLSVALLAPISTQATLIQYDLQGLAGAGLLPGNTVPGVASSGSGGEMGPGITFDDVTKLLTINVGWGSGNGFTDLAGAVVNSHLHGPASQSINAGVIVALPQVDSTASAGYISTSTILSQANEAHLVAGNIYINVHTTNFGAGEIRGNIVAVPEPSSLALAALAGGGVFFLRRRRKKEYPGG